MKLTVSETILLYRNTGTVIFFEFTTMIDEEAEKCRGAKIYPAAPGGKFNYSWF